MTCCVTGHRPSGFIFPRETTCPLYTEYLQQLNSLIEELILLNHTDFITGMADGADIDFAMEVLKLKKYYPHITLEAAIPCPIYNANNRTSYHKSRDYIIESCDNKSVLSNHYHRGCMDKRNRYMVDNADVLITYCKRDTGGTAYTVNYFKQKKPLNEIVYV